MTTARPPRADLSLYSRLVAMARPYWLNIAGVFALGFLSTPLALLVPIPVQLVVDHVVGTVPTPDILTRILGPSPGPIAVLTFAVVLMLGINVVKHVVNLAKGVLREYTGERLVLDFRRRLFGHAQRMSLRYHDREGSADAIYRIQSDASAVQTAALDGIVPFASSLLTVVAMLYVTARLDWTLALIALAVVPLTILVTQLYRRRMRRQWRSVKQYESDALSVVQEVLTSLRIVKAFGQEEREDHRFHEVADAGLKSRVRAMASVYSFGLLVGLTSVGGTALVLYFGARSVLDDRITLGNLLLVISYLSQIYSPLETIGKKLTSLQNAFASAERAFALLDASPDVESPKDGKRLVRAKGEIVFDGVSFSYGNGSRVLNGVSFRVPPGAKVGIAGRTGAGKTTMVNLVTRMYDPDQGAIFLDGVDLRDYALDDLRAQFSIVTQEPILFSTSVAENIEYGLPGATQAQIEEAARSANAHSFVTNLPDQYETQVGERGMRLSGGERQRIALARAFLRDAPILILDEPTSSVDVETEAGIMEAAYRLMHGKTTFMVAHRLSTLEQCDYLIVFEGDSVRLLDSRVESLLGRARDLGSLEAALAVVGRP